MASEHSGVKIDRLTPILAVSDIRAAADFYIRVLGFELDWLWQDPPVHGAVRRDMVQIQLSLNPAAVSRASGIQCFLFVNAVDEIHAQHIAGGANIISPIENKPWGLREYTVRDPWGHQLRFAGTEKYQRPPDARELLPGNIRIVERLPTLEEYLVIVKSVNWSNDPAVIPAALRGSLFAAVAVEASDSTDARAVGMLRIVGDGALAYYIQDVAVMPPYQNRRVGSALMETAMKWLRANAGKGAFVGLFTHKPGFYERSGFRIDGGMHLKI